MGLFRNLGDAFSGNTTHWNNNHNVVVSELFEKTASLPEKGPEIFKKLIILSSFGVEHLVFPKEGKPLLTIDVKSIDRTQFRKLYTILLAFLGAKITGAAPHISKGLKVDLRKVIGEDELPLAKQVFKEISEAPSADLEATRLWKEIISVLNITNSDIQGQLIL